MLQEFREFVMRGSVVDMAVGIIIGAAFTTIVKSLVDDILMPPLGMIIGGVDFENFFITLSGGEYETLADAKAAGAATINYGQFLNNVISFLIVAAALFIVIQAINRMRRKQDVAPEQSPPPARDVQLLEEIRDLMAKAVGGTR